MGVPKHLMDDYLELAKTSNFFGVSLSELSTDELLVCAYMGWDEWKKGITTKKEEIEKILGIIRRP